MFDITFVSDAPEEQPDGWVGLWGSVQLGAYAEDFLAPLGPWQRADYERQWIDAAQRLVSPAARAAFFTAAFQFWWVMWREGKTVIVQEQLLIPERLEGLTDWQAAPYQLIWERQATSGDGTPISEWRLGVADIEGFLARRGG
ncbi:MAG TPA: hypothetical protein VMS17_29000 [Gemmataceae bacterium]|nr:hypothetical protein [Gemmataceae bacterium]